MWGEILTIVFSSVIDILKSFCEFGKKRQSLEKKSVLKFFHNEFGFFGTKKDEHEELA